MKKFVSVFTLACFLTSFVFGEILQATVAPGNGAQRSEQALNDLVIPQSCGRITDFWYPENQSSNSRNSSEPSTLRLGRRNTIVVNIQDLHCHPEVQKNIAKILTGLDGKYALEKIYVEGAAGDVDTSWLCNIEDKALRKKITENLLGQGKLTGTEYYSVTAGKPRVLKGIEDKDIHRQNIARLGTILERKGYYETKLKELKEDLEYLKVKYLSKKNGDFNRFIARYRDNEISSEKYYASLIEYIEDINRNPGGNSTVFASHIDNYPEIKAYVELMRMGKSLNYKRISRQLPEFLRALKAQLPYRTYAALLEKTDNCSKLDDLYVYLAQIIQGPGSKVQGSSEGELSARFPDLMQFLVYMEKSRNINPIELLAEEQQLIEEIRIGLSQDIDELEVSFLADFFGHFEDYLLNKLSADNYEYFSQKFEKFQLIWGKYAFKNELPGLVKDFALLDEYYKVNCQRNECFIKNIDELRFGGLKNRIVKEPGKALDVDLDSKLSHYLDNSQLVVIVTGGFHTEGLKKYFREKHIAYLTITPNITQNTNVSSAIYAELVRHQAKMVAQSLEMRAPITTLSSTLHSELTSLALGFASQASSPEVFQMAAEAAAAELASTEFTENNIKKLVAEIKKATGLPDTNVKIVSFDKNAKKAVIECDGATFTLSGNEKQTVDIIEKTKKSEIPVASKAALEQILAIVKNTEIAARDVVSLVGLISGTYKIQTSVMRYAARHRLIVGKGLIYRIDKKIDLKKILGDELLELTARMPVFVQNAIAEHTEREIAFDRKMKGIRSELYQALLSVQLVKDFAVSVSLKNSADAGGSESESTESGPNASVVDRRGIALLKAENGRKLRCPFFDIGGRIFVRFGDRVVIMERTRFRLDDNGFLEGIFAKDLEKSVLLLGNPSLRRFFHIRALTPVRVAQPLPLGMSIGTEPHELSELFRHRYSRNDIRHALRTLQSVNLIHLANQHQLSGKHLLAYMDAAVIVADPFIERYKEFDRAREQLNILVSLAKAKAIILPDDMASLLEEAENLLPFLEMRKLGYSYLFHDALSRGHSLIKMNPDNKGIVVNNAGKIIECDFLNEASCLSVPDKVEIGTQFIQKGITGKKFEKLAASLRSWIAAGGESSRILQNHFGINKIIGPMIRVKQGREKDVARLFNQAGIKDTLWNDGEYSYAPVGQLVLAAHRDSHFVLGNATIDRVSDRHMPSDVVNRLNPDGTLASGITQGGHGRIIAAVSMRKDIVQQMLAKGKILHYVAGDNLSNEFDGAAMARELLTGGSPMAILTKQQQVRFEGRLGEVRELCLQGKDVRVGGRRVVSVDEGGVIAFEGGSEVNFRRELEEAFEAVRRDVSEAARTFPHEAQATKFRDRLIEISLRYKNEVFDRVSDEISFQVDGQEKEEPLFKIISRGGGAVLLIQGQPVFVEDDQFAGTVTMRHSTIGDVRLPFAVIWTVMLGNFNTNDFVLDPLAIAANRSAAVKKMYHEFLRFARENDADPDAVDAVRHRAERAAAAVLERISPDDWQGRSVLIEQLMFALFPRFLKSRGVKAIVSPTCWRRTSLILKRSFPSARFPPMERW